MNAKLIAMAAAAAAAATSAQAADLPAAAEPVDYVQACDAFGAGFFKLPGKDTCIKVGGRIRVDATSGDLQDSKGDEYKFSSKGYLYLTSMTDTEIGIIKTYTEFTGKHDEKGGEKIGSGDTYIQFSLGAGDLSFGKMGDAFAGFTGFAEVGVADRDWADTGSLQVRFAAPLGNGVTATMALADSNALDGADHKVDLQGALEMAQGWGKVKVSAAAHQSAFDKVGYAVNANGEFTMDAITIGLGGQYAKDALKYAGASNDDVTFAKETGAYLATADDAKKVALNEAMAGKGEGHLVTTEEKALYAAAGVTLDVDDDGELKDTFTAVDLSDTAVANYAISDAVSKALNAKGATAYSFGGGMKFAVTDEVTFAIDGSYLNVSNDGSVSYEIDSEDVAFGYDFNQVSYGVDGSIAYAPVAGLVLALDAGWDRTETDVTYDIVDTKDDSKKASRKSSIEDDNFKVGARIQYTF
ncbi:porin [Polycladidibacter hongkongensis]|uniref:porin n=1 Tax=Polycladidibacter hongkongensis TaxID=1647556 RepID=UPI000836EFDF|nr:porin [Pseudovibrio hongkongensis]